ncbi:hypothetical protein BSKO_09817 [Bryopsis sp. KO-2023]|nr:hypothetical protein BSKO_09817 [Bryopsis sp. KO-2023]
MGFQISNFPCATELVVGNKGWRPHLTRKPLVVQGAHFSGGRRRRRNPDPNRYEVRVITPPPRSLGIHKFPPNTHNGDQIEVDGTDYVVSSVSVRYRRQGGRYVRQPARLDVQTTALYFTTRQLDGLMRKK